MRTLALVSVLLLAGCDFGFDWRKGPERPTPGFLDPNQVKEDDPSVRSWTNPDVEMSDQERTDILTLCDAIDAQDRANGAAGADKDAYDTVHVLSKWGKEMRTQLNQDGRHVVAPRFAAMLMDESLNRASTSCGAVTQRWLGK